MDQRELLIRVAGHLDAQRDNRQKDGLPNRSRLGDRPTCPRRSRPNVIGGACLVTHRTSLPSLGDKHDLRPGNTGLNPFQVNTEIRIRHHISSSLRYLASLNRRCLL